MMIRDEETGSIWSHAEGLCVQGPLEGTVLERLPCVMTTWMRWRELRPDSRVLAWPDHPLHGDGRHGHGARDYLGRPGIRAGRSFGLTAGDLDERLPENALVFGVNHPEQECAYPLDAVHRAGGLVHDTIGGDPVVVWSPRLDDHLTVGFERRTAAGVLDFELEPGSGGDRLRDTQTGSAWDLDGACVEGELTGTRLEPLDALFVKWHGWSGYHPETVIFEGAAAMPVERLPRKPLATMLQAAESAGFAVEVERPILEALLPSLAVAGVRLRIDGAPLRLIEFASDLGAREYLLGLRHLCRIGRFVLEESPDRRFRDAAQLEPLPDWEIDWSGLSADERLVSVLRDVTDALPDADPGGAPDAVSPSMEAEALGCDELFERLTKAGYAVEKIHQLECRRVRPKAETGYELTIAGDPFLVYRFVDPDDATAFAEWHGHSLAAGAFVFRSDPAVQYKHEGLQASELPADEIDWSALLEDQEFAAVVETVTCRG